MQLHKCTTPLKLSKKNYQPFIWTLNCKSGFDRLSSYLANTSIVQLPDPNKAYLLFTDASKYSYSGILTQASMDESNEALVQLLTDYNSLTSVDSQTQHSKLDVNLVYPIAYISGSFTESQCRWPAITKRCFGISCQSKNVHFTYGIY